MTDISLVLAWKQMIIIGKKTTLVQYIYMLLNILNLKKKSKI